MGLFDWLFNIFRSSPAPPLKISPFDLEGELDRAFSSQARELEGAFLRQGASIKFLLKDIRQKTLALDTSPGDPSDRVEKMVSTSTKASTRSLLNLIDKLQPPANANVFDWRAYAYSSLTALEQAGGFAGKNIAIASFGQKEKFNQLGERLKELGVELESIRGACAQNEWIDARAQIRDLVRDLPDFIPLQKQRSDLEARQSDFETRLVNGRDALHRFESKPEFASIQKFRVRIEELKISEAELRTHLLSMFAPLEKPWRKWAGDSDLSSRLSTANRDLLTALLKNPLDVLLRESKSGAIESALSEWKAMADADPTGDFAKLTDQLDSVLALKFFDEYFWPLNSAQVERSKLEKMLAESPLQEEQKKLARQVEELERQYSQMQIEAGHLEKRLAKMEQDRIAQLETLRQKASELIQRPVEWID